MSLVQVEWVCDWPLPLRAVEGNQSTSVLSHRKRHVFGVVKHAFHTAQSASILLLPTAATSSFAGAYGAAATRSSPIEREIA
jgi:hypothetical protein